VSVIDIYARFFAGTYFCFLRIENRGDLSERLYFAISAILLMSVDWLLLLWGVNLIWFKGVLMSSATLTMVSAAALLAIHYFLFVRQRRYQTLVKKYERRRHGLMWFSIAVHASCATAFFVPALSQIARMP
jgi:hypothetical protein